MRREDLRFWDGSGETPNALVALTWMPGRKAEPKQSGF